MKKFLIGLVLFLLTGVVMVAAAYFSVCGFGGGHPHGVIC